MQMFCASDAKHLHAKHMDDGYFFARDVRRCKTYVRMFCIKGAKHLHANVLQQGKFDNG
jgi:hypothetical protein